MSACGEIGSDMHTFIKELAIRRLKHRSEIHSNESQHLAEGAEVARIRRWFSFALQQRVALAGTRQFRSQGPVSVYVHRTEGVTGWGRG